MVQIQIQIQEQMMKTTVKTCESCESQRRVNRGTVSLVFFDL